MIYLDNGATSWPKPPSVLNEIKNCFKYYAGSPGRGAHDMSLKCGELVFDCRTKVAELLGVPEPEKVIFTSNATHALNVAIKGVIRAGGHVIFTSMEHNSVVRPVIATGISYDIAKADSNGYVNPKTVEGLIRNNTCLIVCTVASNVCGSVQPFERIAEIARKNNILFLLDASQGAGSVKINMKENKIDMLAAPGHKGLYGPSGTGILCLNTDYKLTPIMQGGTGSRSKEFAQPDELPDSLESGTLNFMGIAGLKRGVEFVSKVGIEEINYHENRLANILAEDLSVIKNINIAGYLKERDRIGVVSIYSAYKDSVEIAEKLNSQYKIATRAGYHCAYLAHNTIGTADTGTVRFSIGIFNTVQDVKKAAYAVKRIMQE